MSRILLCDYFCSLLFFVELTTPPSLERYLRDIWDLFRLSWDMMICQQLSKQWLYLEYQT